MPASIHVGPDAVMAARASVAIAGVTGPKLLVTGFGPFPGAPENPSAALVRALAEERPETFGAGAFRAVVLPTDYRRSWAALRRLYASFAPDVVVHFGLNAKAETILVERAARKRCAPERPDAAGFAPRSGLARRSGPETLTTTLPVEEIVAALSEAGFPAAASDDAGGYVCNATLYRSLAAAPPNGTRRVGFIHVPPTGRNGIDAGRLAEAAAVVFRTACEAWSW